MRCFLLLFCICIFASCALNKKQVIEKSIIKLESKNTNIRDFIDIDGYYTSDSTDMSLSRLIFFEDGSCASFFSKIGYSNTDLQLNLDKSIRKEKSGEWGFFWGIYTIQNDTIIIYCYDKPEWFVPWSLSEYKYKIVNRQTLKRIFFKIRTVDKEYDKGLLNPWIDNPALCHFISADSLPSSDNWLKEKKWIWRNESDWMQYMQRIKKEKELRK